MTMEKSWKVWDQEDEYGDVFYDRATGKLPEMESSKAAAKIVKNIVRENDLVLDIGCGSGHYLVSLDKNLEIPFRYCGVDATPSFIDRARKAFSDQARQNEKRKHTEFMVGDIFNLQMQDNSADIVMSNNVLLHLPSVKKPLQELVRVAKKYVLIRMLVGKSSLRIKHVMQPEEFDENGEPKNFYYLNIYSKEYLTSLLESLPKVESYKFIDDKDFDPNSLGSTHYKESGRDEPFDCTTVLDGLQINNHVIQPWHFLLIKIKES